MKVKLGNHSCTVEREPGDPKFRNGGWGSGESRLLYHVKRVLNARGHDLIKRRMHKDGHLMGDDSMQYLRTRNTRAPIVLAIYDGNWQIRDAAEDFNREGRVTFTVSRLDDN
ncbi:hypothetical protein LCGC14_1395960 [marine sediment metagenome]|uniref:Uncharacterized protein n=1 Tax=marine sediment metagenome TaxID=412755 RepID=A0A0F9JYR3_9ZZZZ